MRGVEPMSILSFFSKLFGSKKEKNASEKQKNDNEQESEFKTIKIASSTEKTLKFIPGQFIVLSGRDRGKPIRVAGFPTPEGSIVTIGREPIIGERAYAHIQLELQTISRKHAELNFRDKKLYIKNLSETNPTIVNEKELATGEEAEIALDSELRLGEIKFKYIL